jgi:hypothetical protein
MCLSATSMAVAATDEDVGQLTDEDYENLLTFRATCAVARLVSIFGGLRPDRRRERDCGKRILVKKRRYNSVF